MYKINNRIHLISGEKIYFIFVIFKFFLAKIFVKNVSIDFF